MSLGARLPRLLVLSTLAGAFACGGAAKVQELEQAPVGTEVVIGVNAKRPLRLAIPLMVFFYLLKYGRAGWLWSAFAGIVFAALIIGVFDWTLHVPWHEPLIGGFLP